MPDKGSQSPPLDVAATVALLVDPDQSVRDEAARRLREALADERLRATVDPGEAYWKARINQVAKTGMSILDVEQVLGASKNGGASTGGSTSMGFQLDDYWSFVAHFNSRVEPEQLFEIGPVSRSVRHAWVEPAKGYSGPWLTYYVNGAKSHDIDYENGSYRRLRVYYASGHLVYEQNYVDGQVDGVEVGYHENGTKAYSIQRVAGVNTGRWVWWHENGKMASEQTYVDGKLEGVATRWREDGSMESVHHYHEGKEIGQAAWDKNGKQIFAHGTAAETPE